MVNATEDYKNLLSRHGEYGGSVELSVCFLITRSECIMKIEAISLIMAMEASFVICCFQAIMIQGILMHYTKQLTHLGKKILSKNVNVKDH